MESIDINNLPFEEEMNENEPGSITNFFQLCKLIVQFQDPYFHENMTELFNHFHSRYPVEHTIEDVIEELLGDINYKYPLLEVGVVSGKQDVYDLLIGVYK